MSHHAQREADDAERAMRQIQGATEGNRFCADCSTLNPEFLNLTIGTFICSDCAQVHRENSNRRIKDIYGHDLTAEDVRRMRDVGNEVANKKFLARWNPRDFPEPNPRDKELLREFIWLKYEGSWKRAQAPVQQPPARGYPVRRDDFDSRVSSSRTSYSLGTGREAGREHSLFREPAQRQGPPRSFWTDRFDQPPPTPAPAPPLPPVQRSYREEGYYNMQTAERDRYRRPSPVRSRYHDSLDEDYRDGDGRERHQRLGRSSGPRGERPGYYARKEPDRYRDEQYGPDYGDDVSTDDVEEGRRGSGKKKVTERGKKGSSSKSTQSKGKMKSKSKARKDSDYDSESEEESDDNVEEERRRKSRKAKKPAARKNRNGKHAPSPSESEEESEPEADEEYDEAESSSEEETNDRRRASKSKTKGKKARGKNGSRQVGGDEVNGISKTSTEGGDAVGGKGETGHDGKAEFDLMSDWMGTESGQSAPSGPPANVSPIVGATPAAYVTQQVPAMPPMSVYPGMMMPGSMMMMPPGSVMPPFQGMMGMPPPPNYIPNMHGGMPQMPPVMPGGLVQGMQNMGVSPNQPAPPPPPQTVVAQTNNAPPPPPGPPPPS